MEVRAKEVVFCMLLLNSLLLAGNEPGQIPPPREVPVVAEVGGVPVYGYGDAFINGLCPDFDKNVVIQKKNKYAQEKIKPKKSWEIKENFIGATPPRVPRSWKLDFQPFLWINLIDGKHDTYWCSRGTPQPDMEPAWIRIDLAKETKLKSINIIPRKDNAGIPSKLSVRVSRDALQWSEVGYKKSEGVVAGLDEINHNLKTQIEINGNLLPMGCGVVCGLVTGTSAGTDRTRRAIYTCPPWKDVPAKAGSGSRLTRISFPVTLPESECYLNLYVGLRKEVEGRSDGFAVSVRVDDAILGKIDYKKTDTGWFPLSVPLKAWMNKTITPELVIHTGPHDDPSYDQVLLGEITVSHFPLKANPEDLNTQPKANQHPIAFEVDSQPVKQIWIEGREFSTIRNYGHSFSIAEVEAIDENNENAALASRGAGVTVSSTNYGYGDKRELHDMLWPVHYDLGVKWIRINYWDSALQWHYVEQEKGKYVIDPLTDRWITDSVDNGCDIVLGLCYGNWLYAEEPRSNLANNIWPIPYDPPPSPTTPKMVEGFKDYVRFMVRHFKDRIKWYEVWNEPHCEYAWPSGPSEKEFCDLVKEIVPIIKEEYPESKILLGSAAMGSWTENCAKEGIGPIVDAVGWHPWYNSGTEAFNSYPQTVADIRNQFESTGFKGIYMATEFTWVAPYPKGSGNNSEIMKAKNLARGILLNLALGVYAFWNETWNTQNTHWDVGLFRNTFSSNPYHSVTCQPAYYVMRTLCTVMDDAKPAEVPMELRGKDSQQIDHWGFKFPDGDRMIALWVRDVCQDNYEGITTDLHLNGLVAAKATAFETLNGLTQNLVFNPQAGNTIIKNLIVRDYPLLIRITQ